MNFLCPGPVQFDRIGLFSNFDIVKRIDAIYLLGAILLAQCELPVMAAEGYPSRPIRMIVPAAPGGAPDIAGRLIASEIGKQMGQLVVVENRPGGGGVIGFEATARATPDGYTIGLATFPIATNPSMFAKLPYDALRDFQMVVQLASGVNLLAVGLAQPFRSVSELREYALRMPGKLSFGSSGNGTSMHLSMELFKQMTGTNILHVPYKAIQQAITDTMSGQISVVSDNMASVLPHVKADRMRALGVTSAKRTPVMPELPTVAEQGVSGYEMTPWSGFMVPARVPPAVLSRLNSEINAAIRSPMLREKYFATSGSTPVGGTSAQFSEHVRREITKWGQVLKAAGIQME